MTISNMASLSVNTAYAYANYNNSIRNGASGNRINSAADDAAGLAISSSMDAQIATSSQQIKNNQDLQSMSAVKEGALSSVSEQLSRMKTLASSATKSFYGEEERSAIQMEIDSIKDDIKGIYDNAEFNGKKLFEDNAFDDLGISDFSVVDGNYDSDTIEDAINKVSLDRGEEGAETNSLQSTIDYLRNSTYNLTSSMSKISDQDMFKLASKLSKDKTMSSIQMLMQNNQQGLLKQMQYNFLNMLA